MRKGRVCDLHAHATCASRMPKVHSTGQMRMQGERSLGAFLHKNCQEARSWTEECALFLISIEQRMPGERGRSWRPITHRLAKQHIKRLYKLYVSSWATLLSMKIYLHHGM